MLLPFLRMRHEAGGQFLHACAGPNTGGKTASLKLLGLCAIMAKAGLHVHTADPTAWPCLPWFDHVRCSLCIHYNLDRQK